jgi:hypothetical protein
LHRFLPDELGSFCLFLFVKVLAGAIAVVQRESERVSLSKEKSYLSMICIFGGALFSWFCLLV